MHNNIILSIQKNQYANDRNLYILTIPSKIPPDLNTVSQFCDKILKDYNTENGTNYYLSRSWDTFVNIPNSFLKKYNTSLTQIDTTHYFEFIPTEPVYQSPTPPNTKIKYLHKENNARIKSIVCGNLTPEQQTQIMKNCKNGCKFIPKLVNLSGSPETEFHELYIDFTEYTYEKPTHDMTTDKLVENFVKANENNWQTDSKAL